MPVPSETEVVEFKDWRLRVRPAYAQPARLLLMIHGWTGDENSMWVFANDLPANLWMVAPRAPYATDPSGFSWGAPSDGGHRPASLELLKPSVQALIQLVDAYAGSQGIDPQRFDVIGFSQGAALGIILSMMHPERVNKLAVLAGFVPRGSEGLIAEQPLSGKKVFVAHGTTDALVPIEMARSSIEALERAGAQVQFCEAEVGHKVSADCLRALRAYLQ